MKKDNDKNTEPKPPIFTLTQTLLIVLIAITTTCLSAGVLFLLLLGNIQKTQKRLYKQNYKLAKRLAEKIDNLEQGLTSKINNLKQEQIPPENSLTLFNNNPADNAQETVENNINTNLSNAYETDQDFCPANETDQDFCPANETASRFLP